MKSTTTAKPITPQAEISYPKLARSNKGTIVLFHASRQGVVVATPEDSARAVGEYLTDWDMKGFTNLPETESVTISN